MGAVFMSYQYCRVICTPVRNYKKISVLIKTYDANWTGRDVGQYLCFLQLVAMKKKTSVLWHLLLIAALDIPLVLFDPVKTLH